MNRRVLGDLAEQVEERFGQLVRVLPYEGLPPAGVRPVEPGNETVVILGNHLRPVRERGVNDCQGLEAGFLRILTADRFAKRSSGSGFHGPFAVAPR